MEPNSVGAEIFGRLSYTGGSSDDGHDASKGSWYGQLDLSGVDGGAGKSWAAYYQRIYSGPAANHRIVYREQTNLRSMQGGGRRRGSNNRQFWWMQSFDKEESRALASAGGIVVSDEEEEEELISP